LKPLRILLADDHEVVRRGTRVLLESQPGWEVIGEAVTGREAVSKAEKLKPDIAILDVGMPELNGLEAARQIRAAVPECEVLVLSMHESEDIVREVLKAGARGYVLKSDAGLDLVAAVRSLRAHKPFFTSAVARMVLDGYVRNVSEQPTEESHALLTPREREIVQLLAEGKGNKEVASALGVSVRTAETHRANIMHKLGLHSMADLVRFAIRNNIVVP
jgi:DNA-binding NarL/FixJ family response regulator